MIPTWASESPRGRLPSTTKLTLTGVGDLKKDKYSETLSPLIAKNFLYTYLY